MNVSASSSNTSGESRGPNFELDQATISAEYERQRPIYEALKQEIVFILEDRIAAEKIKIHTIEARVKELPSLLVKCARKNCNDPFREFVDIAASRVVCLFRSDIERLKRLVTDNFEIIAIDDKLQKGNDPLGYLSVHMICKIKPGYSGPRYEKILGKVFEIQLRTLCMHCWAAVSHYVDYKGDWDVPANLKMSLSALGGLFFVADSEFEQFNSARMSSKQEAENKSQDLNEEIEINLDTTTAYLARKFPKRETSPAGSISEFVQELKEAGYNNLKEVDRDIDRAIDAFNEFESEKHRPGYFATVGAARGCLDLASPAFRKIRGHHAERSAKYIKKVKRPIEDIQNRE
jgi:putative GTP pyrophosphokinase